MGKVTDLHIPVDYTSPDGYALGVVYRDLRLEVPHRVVSVEQKAHAAAVGLAFGALKEYRITERHVHTLLASIGARWLNMDILFAGNSTKLRVLCNKGHEYYTTYDSAQQAQKRGTNGCAKCAGKAKLTIEDFTCLLTAANLTAVTAAPVSGVFTKFQVCCTAGHLFSTSYNNLRKSLRKYGTNGCAKCAGCARISQADVLALFKLRGDTVLNVEDFVNSQTKLRVQCHCGTIYFPTYSSAKFGSGCPTCALQRRKVEHPHGTIGRYKQGCHCQECKTAVAKAAYARRHATA